MSDCDGGQLPGSRCVLRDWRLDDLDGVLREEWQGRSAG